MEEIILDFHLILEHFSKSAYQLIQLSRLKFSLQIHQCVSLLCLRLVNNMKHGKVKHVVPVNLSYEPSYNKEFFANMIIPKLFILMDDVEFGQVWVGIKKIIKVWFENKKEVPWDWWYYFKQDVFGVSAKERSSCLQDKRTAAVWIETDS